MSRDGNITELVIQVLAMSYFRLDTSLVDKGAFLNYLVYVFNLTLDMYNHGVMSIEQGAFTPLVFSVFGTSAAECKVFLKSLFQKITDKRKENYGDVAS